MGILAERWHTNHSWRRWYETDPHYRWLDEIRRRLKLDTGTVEESIRCKYVERMEQLFVYIMHPERSVRQRSLVAPAVTVEDGVVGEEWLMSYPTDAARERFVSAVIVAFRLRLHFASVCCDDGALSLIHI